MGKTENVSELSGRKGGWVIPALCRILGIILIVVVVAFALAMVLPPRFGYEVFNIMSGSMEPELPVGSIIYVKQTDPAELVKGDIIVYDRNIEGEYDLEGFIVAHRIVENRTIEGKIITKGDANETNDVSPVPYSAVRGIVTFHLPMLGEFMTIYTTLPGKICMIGVALCGFLLNILAGRIADRNRYDREKDR